MNKTPTAAEKQTLENANMIFSVGQLLSKVRALREAEITHPVCKQKRVILLWRDEYCQMISEVQRLENKIDEILKTKTPIKP